MAKKRVGLGKTVRFEVFKRDVFTCTYCGQKPPIVVLEVDHIIPVSQGGSNDLENLTTSCFDCNRGKSARSLGSVPDTVAARVELLAEREAQEREFAKLLKSRRRRIEGDVDKIQEAMFPEGGQRFTDTFRTSVRQFLEKLPFDQVHSGAELAALRIKDYDKRCKYFCGICWRTIKGDGRARA